MTKLRMKYMNIDDKTINLSTEEAKTCGKSVKTDTKRRDNKGKTECSVSAQAII